VKGDYVNISGHLDLCGPDLVEGWIHCPGTEEKPHLQVFIEGMLLGECIADRFRIDLKEAGVGDGHVAFSFRIPAGLPIRDYRSIRLRLGEVMYMLPDAFTTFPSAESNVTMLPSVDGAAMAGASRTRVAAR
jgi:hypothetical protein